MERSGKAPLPEASITRAYKRTLTASNRLLSRRGEMMKLDARLHQIGLMRYLIPGDGNCLYSALSHQMVSQGPAVISPLEVKRRIFHRMRREPIYRELFEAEVLVDFGSFEEYIRIKEFGTGQVAWGGLPEVVVFCDEFQRRVCLFMFNSSFHVDPSDAIGPPSSSGALLIAYVGQNHYDSVIPLSQPHRKLIPAPLRRTINIETPEAVVQQAVHVELYDDMCINCIIEDMIQEHSGEKAWKVQMPYAIEVGLRSGVGAPGTKFVQLDVTTFRDIVFNNEEFVVRIVPWQQPPPTTGGRIRDALRRATSPLRSIGIDRQRKNTPSRRETPPGEPTLAGPPAPLPYEPHRVPRERPITSPPSQPKNTSPPGTTAHVPNPALEPPPEEKAEPVLFEEVMVVINDVQRPGHNEAACTYVTPSQMALVKPDGRVVKVPISELSIKPSLLYPFDSRYFQVFHKKHRLLHFFCSKAPSSVRFKELLTSKSSPPPAKPDHSIWNRLKLEALPPPPVVPNVPPVQPESNHKATNAMPPAEEPQGAAPPSNPTETKPPQSAQVSTAKGSAKVTKEEQPQAAVQPQNGRRKSQSSQRKSEARPPSPTTAPAVMKPNKGQPPNPPAPQEAAHMNGHTVDQGATVKVSEAPVKAKTPPEAPSMPDVPKPAKPSTPEPPANPEAPPMPQVPPSVEIPEESARPPDVTIEGLCNASNHQLAKQRPRGDHRHANNRGPKINHGTDDRDILLSDGSTDMEAIITSSVPSLQLSRSSSCSRSRSPFDGSMIPRITPLHEDRLPSPEKCVLESYSPMSFWEPSQRSVSPFPSARSSSPRPIYNQRSRTPPPPPIRHQSPQPTRYSPHRRRSSPRPLLRPRSPHRSFNKPPPPPPPLYDMHPRHPPPNWDYPPPPPPNPQPFIRSPRENHGWYDGPPAPWGGGGAPMALHRAPSGAGPLIHPSAHVHRSWY